MITEGTIEAIGDEEVTVAGNGKRFSLPLELTPVGISLGQKIWISCDMSEPVAANASAATPQAILNELLHPDDSQRIA